MKIGTYWNGLYTAKQILAIGDALNETVDRYISERNIRVTAGPGDAPDQMKLTIRDVE